MKHQVMYKMPNGTWRTFPQSVYLELKNAKKRIADLKKQGYINEFKIRTVK